MVINYFTKSIKKGINFLIATILNYFYHRNLKKYCTKYKESIIQQYLYLTKFLFKIDFLPINKILKNIFDKIDIYKIKFLLYNNINNRPYILFIIQSIKIDLKNLIEIELNENNDLIGSVVINNIDDHIRIGYKKLSRILSFFLHKQTYIIKNIFIKFHYLNVNVNNIRINKISNLYVINIKKIYIIKQNKTLVLASNINITFNSNSIKVNINKIKITLNDLHDNPFSIIELLDYIKIKTKNKKDVNIEINIDKVYIIYYNINLYKIYCNNININPYSDLKFDDLKIHSFRREILNIYKFSYNLLTKDISNDLVIFNIFNSLSYKIYISFNKYIKKYNVKLPNKVYFDNLSNNLENSYIQKQNYKTKIHSKIHKKFTKNDNVTFHNNYKEINESIIEENSKFVIDDNKTEFNTIVESIILNDDLTSSYIINNSNSSLNICNSYVGDENIIFKYFKLSIDNLIINFRNLNNIDIQWKLDKFNCNIKNNEIDIYTNNFLIKNKIKNSILLKKNNNESNDDNILFINYKNNSLYITIKRVYLNICVESFINMKKYLSNNAIYINKLLYNTCNSDFVIEDFFIHYVSINSSIITIDYYPSKCNYYHILTGDLNELYTITNYENIELRLKEIYLHYPNNFINMFSSITNEWLNDISNNQIKKIIKGTKFGKTVNSLHINYSKDILKVIKKILENIRFYIN